MMNLFYFSVVMTKKINYCFISLITIMEPLIIFIFHKLINYPLIKLANFFVLKDLYFYNNKWFQVKNMINEFLLSNLSLDFWLFKKTQIIKFN